MIREIIEDAQKERRRRETEGPRNLALGTLIGTAVGATLGILFAPKSGKETRKDIVDRAQEEYNKAEDMVNETVDTVKQKTDDAVESVKDKYEEVADNVKDKYKEFSDRNMIEINTADSAVEAIKSGEEPVIEVNMDIDKKDKHKDKDKPFLDPDAKKEHLPKDEKDEKSGK